MKSIALLLAAASVAFAQVRPNVAKQLVNVGRGVCVPETAQIYNPLQLPADNKGLTIERDQSFGPAPQNVLDVFSGEKGGNSRTVLVYVSGGAGNKQQGGVDGAPFYDNVMRWAVKNEMVGVNVQRRPGEAWDDPAKDISLVVQWVQANIKKYKGNPNRVFMWAQSAGNIPVSTYVGHPEYYGSKGIGLKGVVFMSAPGFNILPVTPPAAQGGTGPCGTPSGEPVAAVAAKGKGGPGGGGKGGAPGGGAAGKGKAAPVDAATQLARSNFPGMVKSKVPFFVSVAELDPPNIIVFAETLRDELVKAKHPTTFANFKDHSHISEVMSPNTADTSVTGPILKWIKSVK